MEQQATTLLSIAGLVGTIWAGIGQLIIGYSERRVYPRFGVFLAVVFGFTLCSFLLSIAFALRALRRIQIHVVLVDEIEPMLSDDESSYRQRANDLFIQVTRDNYAKTDWKVRNVIRAQRAFFGGLVGVLIGGMGTATVALYNLMR